MYEPGTGVIAGGSEPLKNVIKLYRIIQNKTKKERRKHNTYYKPKREWGVDPGQLNDLLQNILKAEYKKYRRLQGENREKTGRKCD